MKPENLQAVYRLTPTQEGILFHVLAAPAKDPYFLQTACALRGRLDTEAFRRAWEGVVARHPALRTAFQWEGLEKPVQVVSRAVPLHWEELDWTGLPAGELERSWEELLRADHQRGLDLSQAPPLRLTLVRLGEDHHRFLWSCHHIILDGWCLPLIFRDVFTFYSGLVAGRPVSLPPARPYGDYVAWLRRQDLSAAEAWWRRELGDFTAPTPLPLESAARAGEGSGQASLDLPEPVTAALTALARRRQLTLNTVVQGAWGLLLSRMTGEADVVFGAVFSGRSAPVPGIESMLGLFINTLPVRVRVREDLPVEAWLQGLQEERSRLIEHEASPLIEVQGWSGVPHGLPLFESIVAFENYPVDRAAGLPAGILGIEILPGQSGSHYPLALRVFEGDRLALHLSYSRARFDDSSAGRLLDGLGRLLEGIAAHPERPLADLPLLSGAELEEMARWGRGDEAPVPDATLHVLFEAGAAAAPDAAAVTFPGGAWSYGELNRRANYIAHRLRGLGVGPESRVGIRLEHSPAMLAAVLGVLKAGGAYLPLDPGLPAERLAWMAEAAGAMTVLDDPADLEGEREDAPRSGAAPGNAAYVLFTSGSTGRPKGVVVEHRSLVNYLAWANRTLPPVPLPAITRLSFDASLKQLLAPLLRGGEVWLLPEGTAADPEALLAELATRRGVGLNCVPSLWRVLLGRIEAGGLSALLLGGEAVEPELLERTRRAMPEVEIWNLYGPTEATANATAGRLRDGGPVTLGGPIDNARLHILDAALRPVAPGVPGELVIGGAGVARGYLGRPDLTAGRFVPDPFGGSGERLYRTGDLCRFLPEGGIEYLGRADHQVKLRGFRIELGEIEAALRAHGAREAVVLAREERLVAYVVGAPPVSELREALRRTLPEYTVPSAWVVLDALPLSPNGKVDRRALPAPETAGEESWQEPATPAQQIVAGIFADVLGVERVGRGGHFFELGGHSLLATRAISRLRNAFGVELPLWALFEAPVVEDFAARVESELRAGAGPVAPPIVPVPRDGALPLSFAQQRLWFLDQLVPGSSLYNIPLSLWTEGDLDATVLARSLEEVVRRHEVLRTVFVEIESAPAQVVQPPGPFPLPVVDLGALPASAREAEARRLAAAEAARPFDLQEGPLLRASLLRLAPAGHVVTLTLHHIVSDGWSTGVLTRELAALYEAFAAGRPSPLPELPLQYGDYAVWQRRWLAGETLEAELAYWRSRLAGAPPLLELPTDRPRPAVQTHRAASRELRLSKNLTGAIDKLGRRGGTTPFMVLLAGFQAVLSRWSGQRDVSVGTPVAGREAVEIEELIGFFVNTLVLRTDLSGNPAFSALLDQVRTTALEAYAHQQVPFEKLVEELAPERSLSYSPLFQVMFTLQNVPLEAIAVEGLSFRPWGGEVAAIPFDLALGFREAGGELAGSLEYNADLLDAATAERLCGYYARLLEAAVARPSQSLADLPLLGEAERAQLIREWNDTGVPHPYEACVHELFKRQAERTPDAVAVSYGERRLSYAGLDRLSDRLAYRLIDLGVGPEVRAGICMERSIELVVALLGVLKAGGAYVPLEPEYPRERLAFMMADTGAAVLLTQEPLLSLVPETPAPVLVLDPDLRVLEGAPERRPRDQAAPANAAYVLFTSGSTGRPKGVVVPHSAVCQHLLWIQSIAPLGEGDCLVQKMALGFDASVWEIFATLLAGARLAMAPAGEQRDPARMAERLLAERATAVLLVPTMLQMLLREPAFAACQQLRYVYSGAEALSEELRRGFFNVLPNTTLFNIYGPTETTIGVAARPYPPGTDAAVSLGRPIHNARLYVADADHQPVPRGAAGELLIGGPGVSRGYLGRPDLTAERFIPDPFGGPGGRLYRTGDLCRFLPSGEIEFLGRADHQVKLRGVRIEPGEIEAALRAHGVPEAVVLVREERLVAYLAPRAATPAISELREALRRALPEHMVPGAWVLLDALPLNPNGKVDRKALPAPEEAAAEAVYLPPVTPAQQIVAGIFSDVLGAERVGLGGHFFELGGHSLLATRAISRLRAAFGVELPLWALFEAPTVEGLAAVVERELRAGVRPVAPPLAPVPRDGALPLSFAQQRLWFLDQLAPGSPLYNIPLALRIEGDLEIPVLARSLEEVVRRHETLRTVFATVEGSPAQVVLPPGPFPLPVIDLESFPESARETEARRLAAEEARRPFDLQRGPLARVSLLRLGPADHVAVLTLHHIVSDGWSMEVLTRELATLYQAFAAGQPSPLPELPVQYGDYAVWQRRWLAGETLEAELAYWRSKLAEAPPLLELPTDRPRPVAQTYNAGVRRVLLSEELAAAIARLGRQSGATPFMVLLAGFQAVLSRWSGQRDVSVGTPIAGREAVEIEELIGFFINTLVLRADLSGGPAFSDLLDQVRTTALEAYAHQQVPFEKLVEELAPERSLGHSPLFQVMFTLQSFPRKALQVEGLIFRPWEGEAIGTKFDLSLGFWDTSGEMPGTLEYNADLWDGSTAGRLCDCFVRLLEAAVAQPARRVSGLPMLSGPELAQILGDWNDTGFPHPYEVCLHELFRRQAERTPDAVAVSHGERRLSYADLDRRSDRLANRLIDLGVGPEIRVGICMERSAELVVALLGVLKAGGAYVPLDPDYPRERLAWMLEDAGAALVITQEPLLPLMPETPVLVLDPELRVLEDAPEQAPRREVLPANAAYVLFTSGSTGRPKGVVIPHAAISHHMLWMQSCYPVGEGDCVLQKTAISFDASVWEFYAPLLAGARLAIASAGEQRDPARLVERLLAERVTVLQVVPTLLQMLLQEPGFAACRELRRVCCGGEPLTEELVWSFHECLPAATLVNLYGPAEATINASSRAFPPGVDAEVSIGRPVHNARLYIVDVDLEPVPRGTAGELLVGGPGVGRGYLGRPDLTAERFIPDPFGAPGERLYRTGDLCRYLPSGEVAFLGRADHQVKLRGFRVELGEIESALRAHGAREAVVVVREDRLVAYVVGAPPVSELRDAVRRVLPEYMVPGAWVTLEALPLSPNGKVDRNALPAPDLAAEEGDHQAPETPVQQLVAWIFAGVLGVERVGLRSDFFELGGHSLLAVRALGRLRSAFGLELPLRVLFEAPTVAGLAARIERELRAGVGAAAPPIMPVPRDGALPLSFAQQRLWFLDQLEPGSPRFNIPLALRIEGDLDAEVLARGLEEVVRRHEALRTIFVAFEGEPAQQVLPPGPFALPVEDVVEREVPRIVAEEAGRPFDLQRGPLLRARLLRLGPADHVAMLTLHHIVSDAWSMEVLTRELTALYEAFAAGRPSPLPELPVQYGDYAVWQRRWLQGEALETLLAHWRTRLAGAATLELPADRPRPEVLSSRGGSVPLTLDTDVTRNLQALARGNGATLFMVMLAAFQALLHRLTHQDDLVVGAPSANRGHSEVEGLIGFFINLLPLRTQLSGSLPFTELVSRVREVALDAYAYGELPFERLVEEIQPERDLSRNPIFQVALQVGHRQEVHAIPGLVLRPIELASGTARFDLNVALTETDREIEGGFEYSSDLFDTATASRIAGHLTTLLAGIAADPGRRLDALPLLAPAERRQILEEWNATASEIPRDACVQDLLAAVARRTPDALAVAYGEDQLTYASLDRRADALAGHLRGLGVGPDVLVGVCLERSPDLIVALLGIMKAGGAYLPLDPSYPAERLAFMLEDADAPVLITSEAFRDRLPAGRAAVVCLEGLDLDAPAGPVAHAATAESLAYVIYTSGSTGRPKGVAVNHRAIMRLVLGTDYVRLRPDDRVAQASNASFDAATFEIWGALLNGACLVGVTRDVALEPREFAAQLRERGITALFLTTALFNQLAREAPGAFAPLRHLLFGGEAVDPTAVRQVLRQSPPERLLHVYGPTESTTFTSWHLVEEVPERARTVPIGLPIANTRIDLLDRGLELVPAGTVGEVYIGGEGLARGYLGRPALTAERFVPDPNGRGERLYRTGDLARRRPDGAIEFMGRTDHQVKVRGFRIEPGEIQAVLDTHPGVRESFVVAREDGGDRRLVAYFVPRPGADPGASGLREHLRERLPDYMVPSAFVALAELPLTPNNKIDRASLPAPALADAAGFAAGDDGAAPRTPTEEILLAIWEELFAGQGIGIRDDFFALGGHSLLAVQLISRVREACAVEVPLRALFERPTIEGLAEEVEQALRAGGDLEMPPLLPADRDEPLPLSFAQQRLWMLDQMEVGLTAYNVPLAVRLQGDLDREALRRSLEEIVHRHEALRTTFEWMDGNPVQAILPPEPLDLPMVDLGGLPEGLREKEATRLARAEAAGPFDLEMDRLFRQTLLVLGAREHALLVTLHHIVSDGWSMGVLVKELSALYTAFRAGFPSPLPDLPVQYADYSVWQRRWMQGETLERQLAYWRTALADVPALDLPTDRPYRSVHTFAGGGRAAVLPRDFSESLTALCRGEKVTLFMALLTAWTAVLHRATGQRRVAVGSPIANRNRIEIEGLIGFFVNTLVLSTDLGGDPSGREALRRVREVTLGAFAHQDMPFQKLVEELQPQRSLQRSPLFQVFFALQNAPQQAASLPGVTLAPLAVESGTAKFELSLGCSETPEGLSVSVEYNSDLFDGATAERLLGQFRTLLAGLVAGPDQRISDLPLLAASERHQIVAEWNDTRRGDVEGALIHRLFEADAAAFPYAEALLSGDTRITYGELNRQANRLARHLRRLGVGLETPVGIFLDSSPELIVGYLAVLKAGGVYVPLGINDPADRLAFMLEETGAPVVLTRRSFTGGLLADLVRFVAVDATEAYAEESEENLDVEVLGHGLAYIIYTSGSTGRPKGVACTHEGVVRLVRESGWVDFEGETFLQITAITFDVSTFEIWGALLNHGRLAFLTSPAPTLEELGKAIAGYGVTTLFLTSGLFGLMVDRRLEDLRPLRQFVAGGDIVPVPQARRVVEELPHIRMVNGYGPTENTTFTVCHTLAPEDVYRPSIPIGRPFGNSTAYVLDGVFQTSPVGIRGELCGGGLGVARGYFGRPDLTADKFIPDPFSDQPGARLYRTGDVARWLPDGTVEFFGRQDTQVKIRGFRIEPGEIETVLGRHSAVGEASVIAREDRAGDRRLVAYIVAAPGAEPSAADLQAFLRRDLPDYMVPSAFVVLDSLPLTTAGKVNRAALPAPEDAARGSQSSYVPPRTELEEKIAAVWREVLGLPQVGVHDNFFDLGGHSLLLLQAVSRLGETLGRELPKGLMFEHPTVATLALALKDEGREEAPAPALEQSQDRAAARRESIRQRRRAPVQAAGPRDPFDDDMEDEE